MSITIPVMINSTPIRPHNSPLRLIPRWKPVPRSGSHHVGQGWMTYGRESVGNIDGYHPNIYYATLGRFDEFLPGIAVAMLKNFHPAQWQRVTRHGHVVFGLGVAASAVMLYLVRRHYYVDGYGYSFFMTAFGYSLIAMAFAVLVVAALSPGSWLHRVRIPGAFHLAMWSYSIYLSHKAVAHVVQGQTKAFSLSSAATLALITLACVVVGAALYRWVEAPFMVLRRRRFPTSFPGDEAHSDQTVRGSRVV